MTDSPTTTALVVETRSVEDELEPHPVAALFHHIGDEDLDNLMADIKKNGLRNPGTTITEGGVKRLLDGVNRQIACKRAGVEFRTQELTGDDPIAFVVSQNIRRRHLTPGQLDFLALDIEKMYAEEGRSNKAALAAEQVKLEPRSPGGQFSPSPRSDGDGSEAGPPPTGRIVPIRPQRRPQARESAAKVVNASGRGVQQAKRVEAHAPDLAEKVRSGQLAMDAADKQLTRRISDNREAEARTVRLTSLVPDTSGPGWRMLHGRMQERLQEIPAGSVDAILTDPPYPTESSPLWSDLGREAKRVLKPQGLLIALSGKITLPDVISRLGEHLSYGWVYSMPTPGQNSRIMGRHLVQTWKPWLVFSNGTWPSGGLGWHPDTTDPSIMRKKDYRWAQATEPAAYMLENLTREGDVVLDPFVGVGTYGKVAVALGREFIGVEADSDRFEKAVRFISQAEVAA